MARYRRAVLRRLKCQDASGRGHYLVRGLWADADGARETWSIAELADGEPWFSPPLPPCPDCGGVLQWAEAGYVPGARQCASCRSLFSVETEIDLRRTRLAQIAAQEDECDRLREEEHDLDPDDSWNTGSVRGSGH